MLSYAQRLLRYARWCQKALQLKDSKKREAGVGAALQGQEDLPQFNCHGHKDRGQSVAFRPKGDRVEVAPVVGVNDWRVRK